MKFIAAHKIMFMVGAVLVGGVVLYLRHKSSSGSTSGAVPAGSAASPDYGGVATSPYNDSGAPQFSFDLGSLLPSGPANPVTTTTTPTAPVTNPPKTGPGSGGAPTPTTPPPTKVSTGAFGPNPPQAPTRPTGPFNGVPEKNPGAGGIGTPTKVSLPTKPTLVPEGTGSTGTPLALQTTTTGQQYQIGGGGRRPV